MGRTQLQMGPVQLLLQQLLMLLVVSHLLHGLLMLEEHVPREAGADLGILDREGMEPWRRPEPRGWS
jgi:hypothetical protein